MLQIILLVISGFACILALVNIVEKGVGDISTLSMMFIGATGYLISEILDIRENLQEINLKMKGGKK